MEDQKVLKIFVDDSLRDSIKEMKNSISKDLAEFRSVAWRLWEKLLQPLFNPQTQLWMLNYGV